MFAFRWHTGGALGAGFTDAVVAAVIDALTKHTTDDKTVESCCALLQTLDSLNGSSKCIAL